MYGRARTPAKPTDYTDDEHPPARLRLWREPDYTGDGPTWCVDGISADGARCTEGMAEYDTWPEAVDALAGFAKFYDLAAVTLHYYEADALNAAAIVHGCGWHITGPGLVTLTGTRTALAALVAAQWSARLVWYSTDPAGYDVVALDDEPVR